MTPGAQVATGCRLRDHMVTFERDDEEPKEKIEDESVENMNEVETLESEEDEETVEASEEECIWRVVVAHRWGGVCSSAPQVSDSPATALPALPALPCRRGAGERQREE